MQRTIVQRIESWKGYDRSSKENRWVGLSTVKAGQPIVRIRRFIDLIPIVGLRVRAHEVEHLICADFKVDATDHHDMPGYEGATGIKAHYCGRSFGWRGFFTLKHLSPASIAAARQLKKKGSCIVDAPPGSRLNPQPTPSATPV